jgi:hypothetical protein
MISCPVYKCLQPIFWRETTSVLQGAREGYSSHNGLVKRCSILFPTRLYIVQYLTTRAKSVLLFDRLAWDKLSTKEVRVWSALYKSLKNENLGHFLELELLRLSLRHMATHSPDSAVPPTKTNRLSILEIGKDHIATFLGMRRSRSSWMRWRGVVHIGKQTVNPGP